MRQLTTKTAVKIIRYFERDQSGECLPYRMTAQGAWARSRPAHLFYFFRKIDLSRYRLFVDLGSGDGAAACVAGLFTRAVGIESDRELVSEAAGAARNFGLDARVDFIRADYFTQRITGADCLFIYPDKPVHSIENMLQGWPGTFLVYGPHFPPRLMEPVATLRCGRETLAMYRSRRGAGGS